jgi:hypothetical protein
MEFLSQNMQVILSAIAVLVILLILLAVWRAFSPRMYGRRGQRLGISEYYELDKTRRLVLLRRDNVEHLVLIGGGQDVVIEAGITPGAGAGAFTPAEAAPMRPAPRPPVFGDRKPPPLRPPGETAAPPARTREEPEL